MNKMMTVVLKFNNVSAELCSSTNTKLFDHLKIFRHNSERVMNDE